MKLWRTVRTKWLMATFLFCGLFLQPPPTAVASFAWETEFTLSDEQPWGKASWGYGAGVLVAEEGAALSEGYTFFETGRLQLLLGRKKSQWGPGRFGSLVLSSEGGVPGLQGEWRGRAWHYPVVLKQIIAPQRSDQNRFFLGHRLEVKMSPLLEVGLSETAVVSGNFTPWMLNPFPLWPYYLTQHLANKVIPGHNQWVNVNLGLDFSARLRQGTLYGELLIDDAQMNLERRDEVPDMIGGLVGYEGPVRWLRGEGRLTMEYVAISNYVYSHKNPNNNYTWDDGTPIGHWLGPDADALILQLTTPTIRGRTINFKLQTERHGEGDIGESWQWGDGKSDLFLSGVVEHRYQLGALVEKQLTEGLALEVSVAWQLRTNATNRAGAVEAGWLFGSKVTYQF